MDTLTHIVLGACIGEAIAGKQLGKKALLLGAIAQNIPDIDFIASFWLPTSADLLAHRGFTHSFLLALLLAPILGLCAQRIFRNANISIKRWTVFWGVQILVHVFIDAFNAYGTGWFEPFSHYRVSFNTMFVADPLFSIWPAFAAAILLIISKINKKRKIISLTAVTISTLYLLLGVFFKINIGDFIKTAVQKEHISSNDFITTPTPLNNLLWYVMVKSDSGYYIGYRSVFEHNENIKFHYVKQNGYLLKSAPNKTDLERLFSFANGYYSADMQHDTLVFNDLRFGEIKGWESPSTPGFVCHYYLQYPDANKMIVQRGRFAGWDKHAVATLLSRIAGD